MASEELDTLIQMLRARPLEETPPVDEARSYFETMAELFPVAGDMKCEPVSVDGMKAEWIAAPEAAEDRAILYLHGGGYAIGSINTHRDLTSRIARAAQALALLIDYRLAPEHPFPAAVHDAAAAYRWLLSNGFKPERTVIAGDSAGGGLTVATLLALRDAGDPLPAAGVCLSPWVDLGVSGESMTTRADIDPLVTRDGVLAMAGYYLGNTDPRTPLASPIYADLDGLPPLLVHVGTAETLYDDATRLAERAKAAGVNVTFEPWADMIHVWHYFASMLPEGRQAIDRVGEFILEHTS